MSPAVARREQPSKHASETGRYHEEGHLSWSDMGDETFVPFPVMRGCRYDASREPRLPGGVTRRFRARRNRMIFMSQSYRAVVGAAIRPARTPATNLGPSYALVLSGRGVASTNGNTPPPARRARSEALGIYSALPYFPLPPPAGWPT
jgi:hypothetical protein